MGPGYAKSARSNAPQPVIAIDPSTSPRPTLTRSTRSRGYWNELRQSGDQDAARRFKGARWALMKRPENLTEPRHLRSKRLRAARGEVWRAYTLKEALRAIFQPGLSLDDVELLSERFISRARRSRLQPFVRLAATIRKAPRRDPCRHRTRRHQRPRRSTQQTKSASSSDAPTASTGPKPHSR